MIYLMCVSSDVQVSSCVLCVCKTCPRAHSASLQLLCCERLFCCCQIFVLLSLMLYFCLLSLLDFCHSALLSLLCRWLFVVIVSFVLDICQLSQLVGNEYVLCGVENQKCTIIWDWANKYALLHSIPNPRPSTLNKDCLHMPASQRTASPTHFN